MEWCFCTTFFFFLDDKGNKARVVVETCVHTAGLIFFSPFGWTQTWSCQPPFIPPQRLPLAHLKITQLTKMVINITDFWQICGGQFFQSLQNDRLLDCLINSHYSKLPPPTSSTLGPRDLPQFKHLEQQRAPGHCFSLWLLSVLMRHAWVKEAILCGCQRVINHA